MGDAVARGVGFLCRSQLPNGEFATQVSRDVNMQDCEWAPSPFATVLILHSLRFVQDGRISALAHRALNFLEHEVEPPGVWRFWSSESELQRSVPPDVDDTCCASYVLRLYNRTIPANEDLILANVDPHGRFYTWFGPGSGQPGTYTLNQEALLWLVAYGQWDNTDAVVNANVLLYLGDGCRTAGARAFVGDTVAHHKEEACSSFYPGPLAFYYMLSRAAIARAPSLKQHADTVVERTLARQLDDGSFGTVLQTALAANVLLSFDHVHADLEPTIERLVAAQQPDGSWPIEPLFVDPMRFYGSDALTTAFCLEALARYQQGT